jgi:hypothetical protein
MVNLLSAAHHLAWTQYPEIWFCESCAILWLAIRIVRSAWVRAGVLLMLCGLFLNGLVTAASGGESSPHHYLRFLLQRLEIPGADAQGPAQFEKEKRITSG